MQTMLIFDVDGTLTGPRRRMHEDFARFFSTVCRNYPVFLVSGSDMPKIEQQLPEGILNLVAGIFPCSGNEFLIDGTVQYRMEHFFPDDLKQFVSGFIDSSPYSTRTGNHLEFRSGTMNVSVVGRNVDHAQRMEYLVYDNETGERDRLVQEIRRNFPEYEATIGGQISVDVAPRGWNKSRVYQELSTRYPGYCMAFFGDNMYVGGNDRPLGDAVKNGHIDNMVFSVADHYHAWKILQQHFYQSQAVELEQAMVA